MSLRDDDARGATAFLLLLALLLLAVGCERSSPSEREKVSSRRDAPAPPPQLTSAFLTRATTALSARLKSETRILELRATGSVFSVQLAGAQPETIVQLDYVEQLTGRSKAQNGTIPRATVLDGEVFGPTVVEIRGGGKVASNMFAFGDIDLQKIAGSFRVAQLAVDPNDGQPIELVVRRYLPFSDRIRARIFVESPRMSGSIDTNESGTPLKR